MSSTRLWRPCRNTLTEELERAARRREIRAWAIAIVTTWVITAALIYAAWQ